MMKPEWMEVAERELARGVREYVGPGDNPRIVEYHSATSFRATDDEVPWCLTGDTEVLTSRGWVRFDHLAGQAMTHPGLEVMQVDPATRTASLSPWVYIEKPYAGDLYVFDRRGLTFGCDPTHRFFGEWGNRGLAAGGAVEARPISALREKLCLPLVERYAPPTYSELPTLADIDFLAAYLADGNRKSPTQVQFNVSRPDKIERLLGMGQPRVYERARLYGRNKVHATNLIFPCPAWLDGMLSAPKALAWDRLLSWDAARLARFVHTYAEFDGSRANKKSTTITTTSVALRDTLEAAAALSGHRVSFTVSPNSFDGVPTRDLQELHYSNTVHSLTLARDHRRIEPFSGSLYCVSVPAGAFLARGGAMPFVTGNCSSFVNWCFQQVGYEGTRSAAARSWLHWGTSLDHPHYGCVVVLARGKNPSLGHVGFFTDRRPDGKILLLGGNQGNAVSIAAFEAARVLSYRWPRGT